MSWNMWTRSSLRNCMNNIFSCCTRNVEGADGGSGAVTGNCVLRCVARVYSRRPFLVLFLTLTLAAILTRFGISEFGFPEFEDPYLGFETRFTPIANKLIALENLRKEVNRLEVLENYPGEKLSGREWRRKRDTDEENVFEEESNFEDDEAFGFGGNYCAKSPLEEYSRIALEIKPGNDIFSHEVLMLICYYEKLLDILPEYNRACEHAGDKDCCPMWSLPSYIADYTNKTDCSLIQDSDIRTFKLEMSFCRETYRNSTKLEACTLKHDLCPETCHRDGYIHSAMFLTVDQTYTIGEDVRFTMIILPVPKSRGSRTRTEILQNALVSITLPKDTVFLAGYDFGNKDWMFKKYLVSDLQYVLIGSVAIFVIVCVYSKSLSVTIISFLALILSLGSSYFLYSAVFKIPYFPFMNMLVAIIVMGIGTDATLILGSQWQRLKSKHKTFDSKTWETMMVNLLEETTGPLFVTTCTTAGAFFASLTSSITTIRCFSIFAGVSILIGFILLYLCVPTTLLLSDLCVSYLNSLFHDQSSDNGGKVSSKIIKIYGKLSGICSFEIPSSLMKCISSNRTILWLISFSVLSCILIWSCFIVFHDPQFQLPNSEQFQLLSTNHPIERFDREIESRFPGTWRPLHDVHSNGEKLTVYFVWGVQPVDTGYGLDPNDNGVLQFDPTFTMNNPKSQKWMRKFCSKMKKQTFYDEISNTVVGAHYDSCFIDTMVKWMKRDCDHVFFKNVTYKPCCKVSKFPYDPDVFTKCVEIAARDVYRTPSTYFHPDIAGPKFFVLREENATEKSGQLSTFTLRVRTNVTFSLSYEKMWAFYNELETFFHKEVGDKVPVGLENGFFISAHLDFFDLQNSLLNDTVGSVLISAGLCFVFLWIFSRSLLIAIGAVLSIFAIVIVASAVLIQGFNWRLGVFESIAVTVAVGLSDFTAHHALEYSKRKSVLNMTFPTFFSALTTITIGLSMWLFSSVLVYQQIGAFFFVLIVVSWIYSVFFLSPILDIFDKVQDFFISACRLYFMDSSSGGGISATVYSNPMINRNSRKDSKFDGGDSVNFSEGDSADFDDGDSISLNSSAMPQIKQKAIIENVKLLKKIAAETSV